MQKKYPWATWFRKKKLVLYRGIHFHNLAKNFVTQIYIESGKRGIRLRIRNWGDMLIITKKKVKVK